MAHAFSHQLLLYMHILLCHQLTVCEIQCVFHMFFFGRMSGQQRMLICTKEQGTPQCDVPLCLCSLRSGELWADVWRPASTAELCLHLASGSLMVHKGMMGVHDQA
jgi:hypothetical protein